MADPPGRPETPSQFDYDRTVALSDGVFAIALTLLVLTISFPQLSGDARHQLGSELENRLPQLWSYLLSFAVLGFLWLRHHTFFRELWRIDMRLATLNLVYLALIAFLPYPTRLLGQYGERAVSVTVYAMTIVLIGGAAALVRLHASRAGLGPPMTDAAWRRQLVPPVVFLVSIPVALVVSPAAAEWFWVLTLIGVPLARAGSR